MRRWFWLAILFALIGLGAYQVWDHFHPEPEFEEVLQEGSPSGRWRAVELLGWVQAGFSVATWVEVRLIDQQQKSEPIIVMGGSQYLLALNWQDDSNLRMTVRNSIHLGRLVRGIGDIKITVTFEPDDPHARRENLIKRKTPKENWWMYDIPVD